MAKAVTPFNVAITLRDDADPANLVLGFTGGTASLHVYGLRDTGWVPFSGLVTAGRTPIDITVGWSQGKWSHALMFDRDENCQAIALMLHDNGKKIGSALVPITNGIHMMIKERQQAVGISQPWSEAVPSDPTRLIDDGGTTLYTLDQLKAYVNAIAPFFTSDSAPVRTRMPEMYPATLADSATNRFDLMFWKLRALDRTIVADMETRPSVQWYGLGTGPSRAQAIAAASNDWHEDENFPFLFPQCETTLMTNGTTWFAHILLQTGAYRNRQPLWTGVEKIAELWMRTRDDFSGTSKTFDKHGRRIADILEWEDVGWFIPPNAEFLEWTPVIALTPRPSDFPITVPPDGTICERGHNLDSPYLRITWSFTAPTLPPER